MEDVQGMPWYFSISETTSFRRDSGGRWVETPAGVVMQGSRTAVAGMLLKKCRQSPGRLMRSCKFFYSRPAEPSIHRHGK